MNLFGFKTKKPKRNRHFTPLRFGPAFASIGNDQIKIFEGELNDRIFDVQKEFSSDDARLILSMEKHRIGHCFAELEKKSITTITVWDVVVDKAYQQKGLASLMIKILARELILLNKTVQFKFRMLQLFKPGAQDVRQQNVGIGVIVYKLGFSCEYDMPNLIRRNNILTVDVIPPFNSIPPAFKIVLSEYPYTLIAFMIDWDTEKPIANYDTYLKFHSRIDVITDWAKTRAMIIGNANYFLKEDGISEFINHIAMSKAEAELFYKKIQGI